MTEASWISNIADSGALRRISECLGYESNRPVRVLVIDDDRCIQCILADYFERHNMSVVSAFQRKDAMRQIAASEPNMVILDIQLGDADGFTLLREIRSQSDVPVILTSGHPHEEMDRVAGLELGDDDCVVKPFGLRELVARTRAVLRRREIGGVLVQREVEQGRCRFGDWQVDRRKRRLTDLTGTPVALTKGEYALLVAFLDAPLRPLTREYLVQATRIHEDQFDRSIDVRILRLRRKIEIDPREPRIILTEHGIGYLFALSVELI
jgi:two-component system, OmpR family, response regulator